MPVKFWHTSLRFWFFLSYLITTVKESLQRKCHWYPKEYSICIHFTLITFYIWICNLKIYNLKWTWNHSVLAITLLTTTSKWEIERGRKILPSIAVHFCPGSILVVLVVSKTVCKEYIVRNCSSHSHTYMRMNVVGPEFSHFGQKLYCIFGF